MTFNPDKSEGGQSNETRSDRAAAALVAYCETLKDASQIDDEDTIADLLCDLRHHCDKYEIDFSAALRSSEINWEGER
jgi:hypothetical protein